VIDEDGICGGSGCPLGTFRDLCGICNGTNDCSEEVQLFDHERQATSEILHWVIPFSIIVGVGAIVFWIYWCYLSCLKSQHFFRANAEWITREYYRKLELGEEVEEWERKVAMAHKEDIDGHNNTFVKYEDIEKYSDVNPIHF
jgi:hypothetical protein